jgi:hypothetical protein
MLAYGIEDKELRLLGRGSVMDEEIACTIDRQITPVFPMKKGLNQLDRMAPEGACNSANEWLSLVLYDVLCVDRILPDGVGSSQHKSHWD